MIEELEIVVAHDEESLAVYREIRRRVFVCEQQVSPDEEFDRHDTETSTIHVLMRGQGKGLGAARIVFEGEGRCHVGRVAIVQEARGLGLGKALIAGVCQIACEHYGKGASVGREVLIELGAKIQAQGFYEKCGFRDKGDKHYMEAGMCHVTMEQLYRCS